MNNNLIFEPFAVHGYYSLVVSVIFFFLMSGPLKRKKNHSEAVLFFVFLKQCFNVHLLQSAQQKTFF